VESTISPERAHLLQKDILRYLVRHPDAKDTVDGIMQWWLSGAYLGLREDELTAALDELARKGWLTVATHGASATVYGLNRPRLDEVLHWLEC
jgi:hypothetical protein